VDEIDSVLSLSFELDDFFALIRACFNRRSEKPAFDRLTFALFGVATPSDLIRDPVRTPFNVGRAIALHGFQYAKIDPLLPGLKGLVLDAAATLKQVLSWTGGQPFLTQKLCQLIQEQASCFNPNSKLQTPKSSFPTVQSSFAEWLDEWVRSQLIENWEAQDEPEHFKTIRA